MKKSKLKKRLRKKYRVGEFRQMGFTVVIKVDENVDNIDEVIDVIVSEKCYCGGGSGKDYHLLSVCPDRRKASIDEDQKSRIVEKLKGLKGVIGAVAGPLRDVWHVSDDDFKEDDEFTEKAFQLLKVKA